MPDFAGKTVMITGCRRGIGRAMVKAFASHGANIIAHARKEDPDFVADMKAESERFHINIQPIYFDMTDVEAMKKEVKVILKQVVPDVLINNAATQHGAFFLLTPLKTIQNVFEINLFAPMRLTQLLLKPMLARKSGSIVNIASVLGMESMPGISAYGSSKAALIAWTRTLAAEAGPAGVRANAIAPSLVETDGGDLMEAKARESMLAACAMHRLARPEEVANTACFLASDEASFINGDVIRVDGGQIL